MKGKLLACFIVLCGLMGGAAMYYLQVYAFYRTVSQNGSNDVMLVNKLNAQSEPIAYYEFQAIDSDSSPIRYRACFKTKTPVEALSVKYKVIEEAIPLNAPNWFECFDSQKIGTAIERGEAVSFLSIKNLTYGIDRIVTILPSGQGYAWNQINHCGKRAFDGKSLPEHCKPPPESF